MAEEEGFQGPRDELLEELGLQFHDLDRWPECDDGPQLPLSLSNLAAALGMTSDAVARLGRQMAAPLAHFQIEANGKIRQLVPIPEQLSNNQNIVGIESYYDFAFPHNEDPKPNFNKNGPVINPHRRHGKG